MNINVYYSDKSEPVKYQVTAEWKEGRVRSGFGTGEILSEDGAVLLPGINGIGWIIANSDLEILEKNTTGHVSMWLTA
jgi:hypothetical protein